MVLLPFLITKQNMELRIAILFCIVSILTHQTHGITFVKTVPQQHIIHPHQSPYHDIQAQERRHYEQSRHEQEIVQHYYAVQQLYGYCQQQGIDFAWSLAARDVTRRCTIINFINGPHPPYAAASPLPAKFQDNFGSKSFTEQLFYTNRDAAKYQEYFHRNLHKVGACGSLEPARAEMRRWQLYPYAGFRKFLRTLLVYNDYMLEIAAQLQHDPEFAQLLRDSHGYAATYITQEADRIRKERAAQKREALQCHESELMHQRHDISSKIYRQQLSEIEQHAVVWQKSNTSRYAAYQATITTNYKQTTQQYQISPHAQRMIQELGISHEQYQELCGNTLQQELMQECITGIEKLTTIRQSIGTHPFQRSIHTEDVHIFEGARQATAMGDCIGSAQLIDLGTTVLEYLYIFAEGATVGCIDGGYSAITGTVGMVLHPIHTAQNIGLLAVKVAELAHAYLPPLHPNLLKIDSHVPEDRISPDSAEAWNNYSQECKRVAQNWKKLSDDIKQIWHTTPTKTIIYTAAHTLTSVPTNILVAHRCTSLLSTAAQYANPPIMSAVTATSKALSEVEWISRLSQYFVLNTYAITHAIKTGTTAVSEKISKLAYKYLLPAGETAAVEAQTGITLHAAEMELTNTQAPSKSTPTKAVINSYNYLHGPIELAVQKITMTGKQLGLSEEIITQALANLECAEVEGCIKTFAQAIHEFEHIPGAHEVIKKIFDSSVISNKFINAKGSFNELRSGLQIKSEGHTILEFSKRVGEFEYDIITDKYVIECKNWNWKQSKNNAEKLSKLQKQAFRGTAYANQVGKKFIIMLRYPIPAEFYQIEQELLNIGAKIIIG